MKMKRSVVFLKIKFENKYLKDKKFVKFDIVVIIQKNIEI